MPSQEKAGEGPERQGHDGYLVPSYPRFLGRDESGRIGTNLLRGMLYCAE